MKGWIIALVILIALGYVYYYHPSLITGLLSQFGVQSARFQTHISIPSTTPSLGVLGTTPDIICKNLCASMCANDNMVYYFSRANDTLISDNYTFTSYYDCLCGCN